MDSRLPFESNSFDAVICTVSVEYLIDPLAVFEEVSRVSANRWLFHRYIFQPLVPDQGH